MGWSPLLRTIVTWDWVTPEVVETAGIITVTVFIIYVACQWIRDTVILGVLGGILSIPCPVTE